MVWGIVRNKHRNWASKNWNVTRNIERVTATNKTGNIASVHMWIGKITNSNNPTKHNIKWQPWDLDSSLRCLLASPWFHGWNCQFDGLQLIPLIEVSCKWGTPIAGWLVEHPNLKMDEFWVPLFQETTKMCIYIYIIFVKQALAHLSGVTFSDTTHQYMTKMGNPAGWWPVA